MGHKEKKMRKFLVSNIIKGISRGGACPSGLAEGSIESAGQVGNSARFAETCPNLEIFEPVILLFLYYD